MWWYIMERCQFEQDQDLATAISSHDIVWENPKYLLTKVSFPLKMREFDVIHV